MIISICLANAHLPDPTVMDHSAAKAALAPFSKALSMEGGPQGIRANMLNSAFDARPSQMPASVASLGIADRTVVPCSDHHLEAFGHEH